jgi:hypothetical protein
VFTWPELSVVAIIMYRNWCSAGYNWSEGMVVGRGWFEVRDGLRKEMVGVRGQNERRDG